MEEKYDIILKIAKHISTIMRLGRAEDDSGFKKWLDEAEIEESSLGLLSNEEQLERAVGSFNQNELCEKTVQKLKSQLTSIRRKQRIIIAKRMVASVAAVFIISAVVWVGYLSYNEDNRPKVSAIYNRMAATIVSPTLILDNGTDIRLDEVSEMTNGYDKLIAVSPSKIGYNKIDSCDYSQKFNTLIVPSLFTYTIELSDGTCVVLNAQSKLIYPVAFNNINREVILEGEAFFDVAKSNVPFSVKTNGVNVKVYGTKFNINSYSNSKTEVVLLSGSVGVSLNGGGDLREHILKPNQLINIGAYWSEVRDVDANDYVSWKYGRIKSCDAVLDDFITKMSNWYGVDIKFFDDAKRAISITASFDREQPIENVISAIEYSVKVKFVKDERGYTIY